MPSATTSHSDDTGPDYSTHELGQMLFDLQLRFAANEKKMIAHRFDHESFTRQQQQTNQNLEDTMKQLLQAVDKLNRALPGVSQSSPSPTVRGWQVPPSTTTKPGSFDPDLWPKLKLDPPRFDGSNVTQWITRIQKYYNHNFTPLADRLYLTEFLLDDAAADWFAYWTANNSDKSWDDFLVDAKLRFDPDLYEDYVVRLASLRQTGSLDDYLAAFESTLAKVGTIGDATLTSLFIAGLSSSSAQSCSLDGRLPYATP